MNIEIQNGWKIFFVILCGILEWPYIVNLSWYYRHRHPYISYTIFQVYLTSMTTWCSNKVKIILLSPQFSITPPGRQDGLPFSLPIFRRAGNSLLLHYMPCYHHQSQQKLKAVTRKCNNEFTSLENYNFCGSLRRERMVAHAMISWSSQSTKKCFYCEVSTNFLFEFTTQRSSTAYSVSFFLTSLFSHLPPSSYQLLTKIAHWCYFLSKMCCHISWIWK